MALTVPTHFLKRNPYGFSMTNPSFRPARIGGFSGSATFQFHRCRLIHRLTNNPFPKQNHLLSLNTQTPCPPRGACLIQPGPTGLHPCGARRVRFLSKPPTSLQRFSVKPILIKNQVWMRPHERCKPHSNLNLCPCQRKQTTYNAPAAGPAIQALPLGKYPHQSRIARISARAVREWPMMR